MKVLISLFAVVATLLFSSSALADPFVTVDIVSDVNRGGREFNFTIVGSDIPTNENFNLTIYIEKNGYVLPFDLYDEQGHLTCSQTNTPNCSIFLPNDTEAGDYNIYYNIEFFSSSNYFEGYISQVIFDTIPRWWNDFTVLESKQDIFNGDTDVSIRFDNVPINIENLSIQAMFDGSLSGYFDTVNSSTQCVLGAVSTDPKVFICTINVPPLCTENDRSSCNGDEAFGFRINNLLDINYSVSAIHYQLTAYEEGSFFGYQNFVQGGRLEDRLNMDTYLYSDASFNGCYYGDGNFLICFDVGYYDAWIAQYSQKLSELMTSQGNFDVVDGEYDRSVAVNAHIPMLPIGANGFKVTLYYNFVGDAEGTELDLVCGVESCEELTIPDLPAGKYEFALKVYNNHPEITLLDESYEPYIFGNYLFRTIAFGQTITIEESKARVCHKGRKTKKVASTSVNAHLAHGDQLGKCESTDRLRYLFWKLRNWGSSSF